ncbi:OmpA family protein [Rhodobacter sp. KR11]|uniref:OmpA family protein n=1 Tax=Rhodobacter sp. KR11 TaxID=2974588 RepID=UPI0022231EFC|nr:OmpA family protein [Rhodobacter sp. KR11]MCW1917929.1 OmpA family protein [Rhodobacter sp. KR11]
MTRAVARVAFGALMIFSAGVTLAPAAFAQDDSDLSAEELALRFQAQSEQLTRGLVIAPTTAEPASAEAAAALPPDTTYVAVDPAAQVNIQIEFAFDSAAIGAGQNEKLTTLCQVIKASDIPAFKIIGHTDASGTESYNQNLSKLRAEEVKRHLVEDCGIDGAKLLAEGVGEAFPADASDPKADANRRVEFQVGS